MSTQNNANQAGHFDSNAATSPQTLAERIRTRLTNWRIVLIALVALAQAGVLVFMVVDRETLLSKGRKLDIHVRPIDPRDLFRGDYVTLTYDISSIPRTFISGDLHKGEKIYVRLAKTGDEWKPVAAGRSLQQAGSQIASEADEVTLAAHVWYAAKLEWREPGATIQVRYGIEKFFVPEGEGHTIEKEVRAKAVIAHVAVGEDGKAALSGLTVAGQRYDLPPLF